MLPSVRKRDGVRPRIARVAAYDSPMPRHRHAPLQRLTQPLVRDGGVLRPASWEEALGRAAEGFRRVVAERGPDAMGFFSCSKSTNELNFVLQKFARTVVGTNNIDSCNRT